MERRVLGYETITLLDGSKVDVQIYSVGYSEKMQLVRKFTKDVFEKGHHYRIIDEVAIRDEVMKIALKDIDFNTLDYNADKLYEKYFLPSNEDEKKVKTSTDGSTDTNSQETAQQ